ncbi:unnamed protein product [Ambrosiozyma monospora]|uniref:Unnamed protein product n=1 Tax=Ambrosiozyma monospora TaxID=43982 RepID=A0ACB5TZY5_AMBMO|nr:unnamed protein product [Ambrosiozyma monospora]
MSRIPSLTYRSSSFETKNAEHVDPSDALMTSEEKDADMETEDVAILSVHSDQPKVVDNSEVDNGESADVKGKNNEGDSGAHDAEVDTDDTDVLHVHSDQPEGVKSDSSPPETLIVRSESPEGGENVVNPELEQFSVHSGDSHDSESDDRDSTEEEVARDDADEVPANDEEPAQLGAVSSEKMVQVLSVKSDESASESSANETSSPPQITVNSKVEGISVHSSDDESDDDGDNAEEDSHEISPTPEPVPQITISSSDVPEKRPHEDDNDEQNRTSDTNNQPEELEPEDNRRTKRRRVTSNELDVSTSIASRTRTRSKSPARKDRAYRAPSLKASEAITSSGISTRSGRILSWEAKETKAISTTKPVHNHPVPPVAAVNPRYRLLLAEANDFVEENETNTDTEVMAVKSDSKDANADTSAKKLQVNKRRRPARRGASASSSKLESGN